MAKPKPSSAPKSGVPRRERIRARDSPASGPSDLLSADALDFLLTLHDRFDARRRQLLGQRGEVRALVRAGKRPDFPAETKGVRASEWKVPPPPEDLRDRRVEITGPPERKMVINALNSGARVYMADFEDAHSPTWPGTLEGQANLRDAVRRRIAYVAPDGREYRLNEQTATLMVRPRGWHLEEPHVEVDGRPLSASLFDFGLFFFHNSRELVARGTGPYFYLPKLEHYLEARLWSDVLRLAEETFGLRVGSARATALIETLPAALQMDEILYELRENSAGLNCGRWDYLFSFVKQYQDDGHVVFPDRSALAMTAPFLGAYSQLLIQTCHRRGAHAMGGMAAEIPIRDDPIANERALAAVREDKEREVRAGHDGTWVAHPALVPVAQAVFDAGMRGPNQIAVARNELPVMAEELLRLPQGPVTEEGVRRNARVSVRYLESWLRGIGCVPIDHRMEDAATVEIARSELWQWVHHKAPLGSKGRVTPTVVRQALGAEVDLLRAELGGPSPTLEAAAKLVRDAVLAPALEEYITVVAYPLLEGPRKRAK